MKTYTFIPRPKRVLNIDRAPQDVEDEAAAELHTILREDGGVVAIFYAKDDADQFAVSDKMVEALWSNSWGFCKVFNKTPDKNTIVFPGFGEFDDDERADLAALWLKQQLQPLIRAGRVQVKETP